MGALSHSVPVARGFGAHEDGARRSDRRLRDQPELSTEQAAHRQQLATFTSTTHKPKMPDAK